LPRWERGAWAYALKQINSLRKQGHTIDQMWGDSEELKNHVYTALGDYDEYEADDTNPYIDGRHEGQFTKGKPYEEQDHDSWHKKRDLPSWW